MMKKTTVKAFFILGLFAVLTGCSNTFFDKPEEPGGGIPAGKGAVLWSIEDPGSRTIFPALPFTRYELSFSAAGKDTVTETVTGSSGELMLESGRWELSVNAYIGNDLAAQGSAPVLVLGGRSNSVTVTLQILGVSGTGTGTLSYDLSLPSGLIYAELLAVSLDGSYSTKTSLMTAATGSFTLADGYYILAVSLFRAGQRALITELAHVYDGLTTSGVFDLTAAPFAEAPEISVPAGGAVIYINSAEELAAIAGDIGNPAKNDGKNAYILAEDIDLSAYSPWTPVGTGAPFTGYLFGDGHTIGGLELPGGSAEYTGFFGAVSEARIGNLQVEIPDTDLTLTGTGAQYLGLIAGQADDTVLKDIQVRTVPGGEFRAAKAGGALNVGGLVGRLNSGSLERCGFTGNITVLSGGSASYTGGLAGNGDAGIRESFMAGTITHTNTSAGATGVETAGLANGGTIEDCYHNGTIRASGVNLKTSGLGGTSVSRSYTAGSIVNNGAGYAAGLSNGAAVSNSAALNLAVTGASAARIDSGGGSFTSNYALNTMIINGFVLADAASDPQNHQNGLGKTAAELQSQSAYETGLGWDFAGVWKMGPANYPCPILKWQKRLVDLPDGYGLIELPEDFAVEFSTLSDLEDCLAALPQNSVLDPYPVKLSGLDISADFAVPSFSEADPLGGLFAALSGKYVHLDLSACTGTAIPNLEYANTIDPRQNKAMPVSIKLPSTLTGIVRDLFRGCTSLESVSIPAGVTVIGGLSFAYCESLASIEIPAGVSTIGSLAFQNCTSLESIAIPASVTTIGSGAFQNCSSLVSVELHDGLTSIGSETNSQGVFQGCTSLETISIPATVTAVWRYTFEGCSSLKSVSLPSGLTSIGYQTFQNCSSLESISIPASVTIIESYAFYGCGSLTSIAIPAGLTSIQHGTFWNCSSLTSIAIPAGLTSIGPYAFRACSSLESISIPASVTSIDTLVFNGCDSLELLICEAVSPPSLTGSEYDNSLTGTPAGLVIRVPAASVDAYKTAPVWSMYADKISAIP